MVDAVRREFNTILAKALDEARGISRLAGLFEGSCPS
jgi:hypothetical protein